MTTGNYKLGLYAISILGILFAFKVGNDIAVESYTLLLITAGMFLFAWLILGLGWSIYILIPICWPLTGQIGALPLPLSIRQLIIIFSAAMFFSGLIFKKNKFKATFELIDLWLFINLLYLITVFVRNPVGINALGGGRVGGRPYVDVALAFVAYLMLSRFEISPGLSKKTPFFMLVTVLFSAFAGATATYFPDVGIKLAHFYSDFSPSSLDMGLAQDIVAGETRLGFLQTLGTTLVLLVVCLVNPMNFLEIRYLGYLLLYLSGIAMILLSGFRNAILCLFLYTSVSVIIRERAIGFFKIALFGVLGAVMAAAISYSPLKIPLTFQRALSFLPGNWDQEMVQDARGSSEWRFEMWETALTSDTYIHSKFLGDGFGFLRSDFEIMMAAMNGEGEGFIGGAQQEAFMINGDFHSGPVSSIRFVGYVGLALFLPLMFMTAIYAYRIIQEAYGTGYQLFSLFVGIPIILYPLIFIFIFGDYRADLQFQIYSVGVLKMLSGSIQSWKKSQSVINLKIREKELMAQA